MRPSLIPRRQVGRLCDACRQQLQGRQRAPSSRTLATPSLSRPTAAATSSIAIAQHRRQSPRSATRSVHHSRSPPRSAASEEHPSPPGGDGANSKEAAPAPTSGPGPEVPQTHYDLFPQTLPRGPPPAGPFRVDVRALRREYLALQARAHPDAHARAPSLKRRAEAASARINEAFHTLASPFRRAVYVLRLRGVRDAEDEAARVEDPALLGAVLEARERVEDAASEDDLAAPRAENEDRIRASEAVLEDAFARDDLEAARREVVRLRYWVNVRESIDNWERGRPVVLEH
ncbi:hypothetical protein DL766_004360 [Monosporascus sp. MC13-8B]|uniref:Co-chaperone HscB C-terminal oligomerisation domain-containing protein n=1 Tax=Monosporascus cannonballus TaxID=155416 RepID=A0ABY0H9M9_9PEZI|nr:hypothetical protein DL762_004854 [Monosporascus cannonballus]RYO93004.1 hypothetical protein DL763_004504 [Monosporascus cannonballus]RYP31490.1 hypothetical protein DL766_004360 [Monosporascus sp. MC13-8B]